MINGFNIFVVIIIIWVYFIYLSHPQFKSFEYDEIKGRFKTGDLILFHSLDNINPVFIGCYYGHIGIVYKEPNGELLLFEAFNNRTTPYYNKEHKNGVILADLENRIKTYKGYVFYKELAKPVKKELQTGFKNFIDYAINNMKYTDNIVTNFTKKIIINEELHTETNCGELVYLSLIKLGLLPSSCLDNNRKHHLVITAYITDLNDNKYKEPVYVLNNYFI